MDQSVSIKDMKKAAPQSSDEAKKQPDQVEVDDIAKETEISEPKRETEVEKLTPPERIDQPFFEVKKQLNPGDISFRTFILTQLLLVVIVIAGALYLRFYLDQDFPAYNWANSGPVTTIPHSFNLLVATPSDNSVVFDQTTVVSGTSVPNSIVLITSEKGTVGIQASGQGEFSKVVDLNTGVNELTVSAFDSTGNSKAVQLTLYRSEEKL